MIETKEEPKRRTTLGDGNWEVLEAKEISVAFSAPTGRRGEARGKGKGKKGNKDTNTNLNTTPYWPRLSDTAVHSLQPPNNANTSTRGVESGVGHPWPWAPQACDNCTCDWLVATEKPTGAVPLWSLASSICNPTSSCG